MTITELRRGFTLEDDLMPIIEGKVALPNAKPLTKEVGAAILHYNRMYCGTALLTSGKKWNVRYFLDYGQGGQPYGSGIVAWNVWDIGAFRAAGLTFAICEHARVEGAGADHRRGWHPAHCAKCGTNLSVDSGD